MEHGRQLGIVSDGESELLLRHARASFVLIVLSVPVSIHNAQLETDGGETYAKLSLIVFAYKAHENFFVRR